MTLSNITIGIENLTDQSIRQLKIDMDNYKLIETDTKEFLIHFFRKDIQRSLFINQIANYSNKAVVDFQEHIFYYVTTYLKTLLNIEGLTFSYNRDTFPIIISISLSDLVLCNIDIFNKRIEILEEFYYKDIHDTINTLNDKKLKLEKKYEKYNLYSINSMELLKDKKNLTMIKSIDIVLSSKIKKKNKYKIEYNNKCIDILTEISNINLELNECYMIEETLRKNMLSIKYYQDRISDRICRTLYYSTIKN